MDLFEALEIAPGSIVAAVGGGGKTSVVYELAQEAVRRGLSAVVTTSTRFTRPSRIPMPPLLEAGEEQVVEALRQALRPGAAVVATSGGGVQGRMAGFLPETIAAMAGVVAGGLLTVEADGSAHRPFKAPGEHEPVIPACATHVVVCVGLEVLGQPLDERRVHRPERVIELTGASAGAPITPELVARVLLHPQGGRKGVRPGQRLYALLNNPPTPGHQEEGIALAKRLVAGGYRRAIVASAHRAGDIRAVVTED